MDVVEDKQIDSTLDRKSVVDSPKIEERQSPTAHSMILQVAAASQNIIPWGFNPRERDRQLRSFFPSESWLHSVIYLVSIRNASYTWQVIGKDPEKPQPKYTVNAVDRILNNSNKGRGWTDLIVKTCLDLYTQDNGAFWEILRKDNRNPNSPVLNIAHLDSARCQRTGNAKYPVIYTDRYGVEHLLPSHRVRTLEEFPSPIESAFGLQYCAVTRALMAAEIIQSISVYKMEKVSGQFTKAIDIVSGVTKQNLDDALAYAEEQNLNSQLYYYSQPVILPGVDPTTSLSHVHIDLASLPDNFDEDTSFKWYVAQLAAAFGVDYQEIAPLMTGNLGSSQQSEIMHLKTRGKGPAVIMATFEHIINGLIPDNVVFKFMEQDIRSESEKAEAAFTRSKTRAMQIKSGEVSVSGARELAVQSGDVPRWLATEMDEQVPDDFNTQSPQDEFGPAQVEGGQDTQFTKMTLQDIRDISRAISTSPVDFLEEFSASH